MIIMRAKLSILFHSHNSAMVNCAVIGGEAVSDFRTARPELGQGATENVRREVGDDVSIRATLLSAGRDVEKMSCRKESIR